MALESRGVTYCCWCKTPFRYPNQDGFLLYAALNALVDAVDVQVEGGLIEWQLYMCQ